MPAERRSCNASPVPHALVGRETELGAVVGTFLAALDGSGRALFVRGEPGAGVTSLLETAAWTMPESFRLVWLHGLPDETALNGGAVTRLAAHLGIPADRAPADRTDVAGWGADLLDDLRSVGPVAVVIDDAHWLDDLSVQVVAYCANRLTGLPVSIVFGSATLQRGPDRVSGVDELALAGVDVAAGTELVERHAEGPAAPDVVAALLRATAGNPTALATVAGQLGALELAGLRRRTDPPRLGGRVAESFAAALAGISDLSARTLAAVAAGADTPAYLQVVLGAPEDVVDGLAEIEERGLIELLDGRLRVRHPLVRSVAYHARPSAELRAVHAALAIVGTDAQVAARHLSIATVASDETVAAALEKVADQARREGAAATAATWYAEAHRVSPPGRSGDRRQRLADEATAMARGLDDAVPRPAALIGRATPVTVVTLLGGLSVTVDGAPCPTLNGVPAQALKAIALFGSMHAEALAELLWPGAEPAVGLPRLRNVLNRIRRAAGSAVVRDNESIRLGPGVVVDVADFEELASKAVVAFNSAEASAREQIERALAVYRGELLPGDRYADWTSGPRERMARRRLMLIDLLVERCAQDGDIPAALEQLERGIELDPLDEGRYLRGAQLLAAADRASAALGLLRRAEVALSACGLPLSQQADALVRRLTAPPALRTLAVQRRGEPAPLG